MSDETFNAIAAHIERENVLIRKDILDYHTYLIEREDEDTPADPQEYLAERQNRFITLGLPVEAEAIVQLEQAAGRSLPAGMTAFYTDYGALMGSFNGGELSVMLRSPTTLLPHLAETARPYERLWGLGLHDMMQFCWGNRDDLKAGQGCTQGEIDALNQHTCLGWLGDGFSEAHIYIYEIANDLYSLYHWHQDNDLPEVADSGGVPLDRLIRKMLDAYATLRVAEDDDDGFFDVEILANAVCEQRGVKALTPSLPPRRPLSSSRKNR